MWDSTLRLCIGLTLLVALCAGQNADRSYLPPSNQYLPSADDPAPDINLVGDAAGGNLQFSAPTLQDEQQPEDHSHEHHHHDDHDHHHEHWDLRESIPGEPGQDYPLHHAPPDTGFSCQGKIPGYYADIASGCQSFHVCSGDDVPPQSFLCANGSIFNQEVFACDWWNNVDCQGSEAHYARNSEIGVIPPSNADRIPVNLSPLASNSAEQEIQFQSQSTNEVDRAYLPPLSAQQPKPQVPKYNGPPPLVVTQTAPARTPARAPARITQSPPPPPTRPPPSPTPTTTTAPQPVTDRSYLPPSQEVYQQPERPAAPQLRLPQRPPARVVPTTERPVNAAPVFGQRISTASREFLPPQQSTQTVLRTTTERPFRPIVVAEPARRVQPAVNTNRVPQPARTQTAAVSSLSQTTGYNYPQPSVAFPPSTTAAPVTQRVTQRIVSTTQAPVRQVAYIPPAPQPARTAPKPVPVQPVRPQQVAAAPSFTQTTGYNYPKPSVAFPPSTTAAPVTQRVTQRIVSTTQAPVRQASYLPPAPQPVRPVQPQPVAPAAPSFTQTTGYSYPKPSVAFPPSTTAAPVTQRVTQRIIATQAPARQSFQTTAVPVRRDPVVPSSTQRPSFANVATQSFSQTQGYDYSKPTVQFNTVRPVVSTNSAPLRIQTSAAPFRQQTFDQPARTPQRAPAVTATTAAKTQATEGYSYPRPSQPFSLTSNIASPVVSQTPQRQQTFAQTTFTSAPIRQVTQTPRPTFASAVSTTGYQYSQPPTSLSTPRPFSAVPVRTQTFAPAPVQSQTLTAATPVRTQASVVTTSRPTVTQTYDQNNQGYRYDKPQVSFDLPTNNRFQQQAAPAAAPVVSTTYLPASTTTQRPAAVEQGYLPAVVTEAKTTFTGEIGIKQHQDQSIAVQQNTHVGHQINQGLQQFSSVQQLDITAVRQAAPAPFAPARASYLPPATPVVHQQAQAVVPPCVHQQQQHHHQQNNAIVFTESAPAAPAPQLIQNYLPPAVEPVRSQPVHQEIPIREHDDGYNYPKPKTPFVTGNKNQPQFFADAFDVARKQQHASNFVSQQFSPEEHIGGHHHQQHRQQFTQQSHGQSFINGYNAVVPHSQIFQQHSSNSDQYAGY